MRALTRMRTLAAACALLLFVSGMATAGLGYRVIDRPGTDVRPPTTEAGEADMGHGMVSPPWQDILLALRLSNPWLSSFFRLSRWHYQRAAFVSPTKARG